MIIFPRGGLGNRIRVINSAIELSKIRNEKLFVCWIKDVELNCDFELLFEKSIEFEMIKFRKFYIIFLKLLNKFHTNFPDLVITQFIFRYYHFNININKPYVISDYKKTIIWTWNKFYDYKEMHLHFNEDIYKRTLSICKEFTDSTIGIHIRMSDNLQSIAQSPPSLFELKMDQILASDINTKFFLCTDDLDVKNCFLNKYRNSLITQNIEFDRNSEENIIGAAVDMMCLSKTNLIYGPYFSSFSEVAAEFSLTKRIIIKAE